MLRIYQVSVSVHIRNVIPIVVADILEYIICFTPSTNFAIFYVTNSPTCAIREVPIRLRTIKGKVPIVVAPYISIIIHSCASTLAKKALTVLAWTTFILANIITEIVVHINFIA